MRDRKNDHHRRVVESRLGRKLKTDEVVHHKDEDKTNNADTNLEAEGRGKHTADHNRARPLSKLRGALRMVRERRKLY
jgi:hypothetical protein